MPLNGDQGQRLRHRFSAEFVGLGASQTVGYVCRTKNSLSPTRVHVMFGQRHPRRITGLFGLAALVITIEAVNAPSAVLLALILTIFGYGQGLVMAPLSSAVLSTVKPASAGAGSGMYGTIAQIANAAGVAGIGAVHFAIEAAGSAHAALLAACALFAISIIACAAFLTWMRRATAA